MPVSEAADDSSGRGRRFLLFAIVKLAALGGLVAFALVRLDLGSASLAQASGLLAAAAFALFIAWQFSMAYRWRYCVSLLQPGEPPVPVHRVIAIMWLGNLVSISLLPSLVGQDSAKLAKWRVVSGRFATVAQSIVLLRISGVSGILIVGLLATAGLAALDLGGIEPVGTGPVVLAAVLLLGITGAFALIFWLRRMGSKPPETGWSARFADWAQAIGRLNWRLLLAGIGAQVLFVAMATVALFAVRDIAVGSAAAIVGAAAVGRLLPIGLLGVTAGEGLAAYLLGEVGWELEQVALGAGLPVLFLYATAIAGLLMETAGVAGRRASAKEGPGDE